MNNEEDIVFVEVTESDRLAEGGSLLIEIDGSPIVIFNIAGNLFALDDQCTHDGGPISEGQIEGETIICPQHGARFDILTGKALSLPAVTDLKTYPVKIENGKIFIGLLR